jgi:hypothetical protein
MSSGGDAIPTLVVKERNDVSPVLPSQGVDPQKLVHHQGPEREGEGDEHGEDGTEHYQQIAPQIDERLAREESEPDQSDSPSPLLWSPFWYTISPVS